MLHPPHIRNKFVKRINPDGEIIIRGWDKGEFGKARRSWCSYCGVKMVQDTYKQGQKGIHSPNICTTDHIIPRSKLSGCTRNNTTYACWRCNTSKRSMNLLSFLLDKPFGTVVTDELESKWQLEESKRYRKSDKPRKIAVEKQRDSARWKLVRALRARAGMSFQELKGQNAKKLQVTIADKGEV